MDYAKKRYYELLKQGYSVKKSQGDSFGESPYWEYYIIIPSRGRAIRYGKELLGFNRTKHGGRAEEEWVLI